MKAARRGAGGPADSGNRIGMNDLAGGFPGTFVSADHDLAREFEERLRDSGTLAFRVAYSVLRHREDAEDVAQESLAKAYRSFAQLRDRERFRAWLVRTTWRMALDRRRGDPGASAGSR